MSSISGSSSASSKKDWITPQEQLERLAAAHVIESLFANKDKLAMVGRELDSVTAQDTVKVLSQCFRSSKDEVGSSEALTQLYTPAKREALSEYPANLAPEILAKDRFFQCAVRLVLNASNIPQQRGSVSSLTMMAVSEILNPGPLPTALTNWYVARKKLKILPSKLPPLPWNIGQILRGKCPIYSNKVRGDGVVYKIGDTHILQLLCEEDRDILRFDQVLEIYWEEEAAKKGKICAKLISPDQSTYQDFASKPFEPTHWDLSTRKLLPNTWNTDYRTQVAAINSLNQKAFVNYEYPSLKNIYRVHYLHFLATKEPICYTATDGKRGATRVAEMCEGQPITYEGLLPRSLNPDPNVAVGILARRKFGSPPSPVIIPPLPMVGEGPACFSTKVPRVSIKLAL